LATMSKSEALPEIRLIRRKLIRDKSVLRNQQMNLINGTCEYKLRDSRENRYSERTSNHVCTVSSK
jgi:hypothetical protein